MTAIGIKSIDFFNNASNGVQLKNLQVEAKDVKTKMIKRAEENNTFSKFEYIYINNEFKQILTEQKWFWTNEWQNIIHQSENDIQNGNSESFDNIDDFLASFE